MHTQFSKSSSWPNFIPSEKLLTDLALVAANVGRRRISQTDCSVLHHRVHLLRQHAFQHLPRW